MLDEAFYCRSADAVAPDLLGRILECGGCRGIITETEAYLPGDLASHAYRGRTKRNASMFLRGGHIYVYRIYGIHQCFNVVTGMEGQGEAVLIRSCEPLEGLVEMHRRRYGENAQLAKGYSSANKLRLKKRLCNGPGKLSTAFGISVAEHDGQRLGSASLNILPGTPAADEAVRCPRIGLAPGRGDDVPLRWYIRGNAYISRPDSE
ncbi:MAG: 3-methyladenine DNA glycosylase [Spirochaeta sp. LUC14_002_19_P3]|nr:MAG: 3-methyladenine DNA glycosylase [Spirochaeta sp. LUC14_002_19_P3]